MTILATTTDPAEASQREQGVIAMLRTWGYTLVNTTRWNGEYLLHMRKHRKNRRGVAAGVRELRELYKAGRL
jgi:hypothetical protein